MTRAAAALLAALVLTGNAAAGGAWRTVTDRAGGYSIAVPPAWQVVPRSTAQLDARISRLQAEKRTALAYQYAQIAAVRRATHIVYPFQAFAWPAPQGSVVPDVTVKLADLARGATASDLPRIAQQIAKTLAGSPGATATAPVRRVLPAGVAQQVTGSTRVSKTVRSRFSLYLLIHDKRLYSLTFRGPLTSAERTIAQRFRFVV